jgi:polysaccharide biosynthesis transport protein
MIQRVKEANLASAMKATDIHVLESAITPRRPYRPNILLESGIGLLAGLLVGVIAVIQRARSITAIQDPGEIALEFNVPELGVIPAATHRKALPVRRLLSDSGPASSWQTNETYTHEKALLAESFRLTLASLMLFENDGVRPQLIAFSSANSGEGKTTVTGNLGIALAQSGRRVLLIDADLRRQRLHRIFDVNNNSGLYEALSQGAAPCVKETNIPNLFVLPAGKDAGDKMLFFSSKLRDLLDKLKADFDMVLIDTPPLLQVADARLICNRADGVVLVVAQHTPREIVFRARQHLIDDGSQLLGTVLNKWDPNTSLHGYPTYWNYYNGYYTQGKA